MVLFVSSVESGHLLIGSLPSQQQLRLSAHKNSPFETTNILHKPRVAPLNMLLAVSPSFSPHKGQPHFAKMAALDAFKDYLTLPSWDGASLLSGSVGLLLLLATYLLLSSVNSWRRLRHFPGAFFARISYLPLLRQTWNANLLATLDELEQKYGKVVCIGPNELLCADADEIARISGVRSTWGRSG